MWSWGYKLGGLTLSDVAVAVRVETEAGNGLLDPGYFVPGRDGVVLDPEAPFGPLNIPLRTVLRYTDKNGAITHGDGAAGEVFKNLSAIQAELSKGIVALERNTPYRGVLVADVKQVGDPVEGDVRHAFIWPLIAPAGSWRDKNATTQSGNPPTVTTLGTRRIDDPTLIFSAAGEFELTDAQGNVYNIEAAAGPDYPVTIKVGGQAGEGTIIDDSAADASGAVTFSHRAWLRLSPAHTHVVTSDVSCTVTWRNRWT